MCHAAACGESPGLRKLRNSGPVSQAAFPRPPPQRPDGGWAGCGARSRGGALKPLPVAPTPGVRLPEGRRAQAGKPLGAAQTGQDGTRAAPPHLSPAAFPGDPPKVGEEEPPKPIVHRPLPAAAGCCRSPRGGCKHSPGVPPKYPPPIQSLIKHFLPVPKAGGTAQSQSLVEALYPL